GKGGWIARRRQQTAALVLYQLRYRAAGGANNRARRGHCFGYHQPERLRPGGAGYNVCRGVQVRHVARWTRQHYALGDTQLRCSFLQDRADGSAAWYDEVAQLRRVVAREDTPRGRDLLEDGRHRLEELDLALVAAQSAG